MKISKGFLDISKWGKDYNLGLDEIYPQEAISIDILRFNWSIEYSVTNDKAINFRPKVPPFIQFTSRMNIQCICFILTELSILKSVEGILNSISHCSWLISCYVRLSVLLVLESLHAKVCWMPNTYSDPDLERAYIVLMPILYATVLPNLLEEHILAITATGLGYIVETSSVELWFVVLL